MKQKERKQEQKNDVEKEICNEDKKKKKMKRIKNRWLKNEIIFIFTNSSVLEWIIK